jgi:hypothetical protein
MRAIALAYTTLFLMDGLLSIFDSWPPTRTHHFSSWTTDLLLVVSLPFLVSGLVLWSRINLRPRWPLILPSFVYSGLLVAALAVVIAMVASHNAATLERSMENYHSWRIVSLIAGGLQVLIGVVCVTFMARATPMPKNIIE